MLASPSVRNLCIVLCSVLSAPLAALTFTVNSTADVAAGGTLANGVCETASGNGVCTLRAALQKAIAYPGGGVTIALPAGTYTRASTYPSITAPLTIQGAAATQTIVDANGLDRGFLIDNGPVVTIAGVTIQRAASPGPSAIGNGVLIVSGTLNLQDCQISDGRNGGLWNESGGTTTIRNCNLLRNTSDFGAAISNEGALTVVDSLIAFNRATTGGVLELQASGRTMIVNSTISNNGSGAYGTAIRVVQSTSEVDIYNSTIAGNVLDSATATASQFAGGIDNSARGVVHLQNSVLAHNYVGTTASDCLGPIVSLDYNALQTTANCTITGATSHNQIGGDPLLDELRANGGPTLTRALLAGSPLVDAVPRAQCTDQLGAPLVTDQRGQARPAGPTCDIGAYEGSVATAALDTNLMRNGDAEASLGAASAAFVASPYWTVTQGQFTVTAYGAAGGFPLPGTDPVPANHGASLFTGGNAATSQAQQTIPLASVAAAIDTGSLRYVVSGDFGGYLTDNDNASMIVTFQNASHAPLGSGITIGGVTATQRNNQTGLINAATAGLVPVGARFALVSVQMTRAAGTNNDGYADNLSLILTSGPSAPDLNQHGLTGSWYNPATSGQGFELEVFPNASGAGSAQLSWFTFDTGAGAADHQRWFTLSGAMTSGQPSATLTLYQNTGGNFDAPPVTTAQALGTATLTFDSCTTGLLSYRFNDGSGRAGNIPFARLTQDVTCSLTSARPTNPDFALSGNWYDAATSGQGFSIEINPASAVAFVAWYTYAVAGSAAAASGQRWYTAQGGFMPGARSMPLQIYETTGGIFDTGTAPGPATVPVGSATLTFQSCTSATFAYVFTGGSSSGRSRTITLARVGPAPPGCAS
jgi:Right handed beta helix region